MISNFLIRNVSTRSPTNQSYLEYDICPSNVLSDQNKRWTHNPYEKVAKLEEDRLLKPDIDAMIALVKSQAFNVNVGE